MNNRFTHLLITRCSYPEDYEHLKKRLELFRKYTVPSVQKQTNQNFIWVIQSKNPEWFEGIDCVVQDIQGLEEMLVLVETEWVITSRVDNDDILHKHYIRDIQANFEPRHLVIDFLGYRHNLSTGKCVEFDAPYKNNPSPFATLIQKSGNTKRGIMSYKHGDLGNFFPVKRIKDRRWIQLIHSTNKLMKWSDAHKEVERGKLWM